MTDIRLLKSSDIHEMVSCFAECNWSKPRTLFEQYYQDQQNLKRLVWVAYFQGNFAGYVTLAWISQYYSFASKNIPEIMDLNVLPLYRNKGIGSTLLEMAEAEAFKKHNIVGLGVGLYKDYGSAQRLYIKRGYIPDGLGVTYNYQRVLPGSNVCVDDDLILWLIKGKIEEMPDVELSGGESGIRTHDSARTE